MRLVKKPTKAKAFALVKELHEQGHDVAELLMYFAGTSAKKSRTVWEWVAKAAANPKKEKREQLTVLNVTAGGELQACDGHRLHFAQLDEPVEPGFYCAKTFARLDPQPDFRFPDVDRVKPKWNTDKPIQKVGTQAFESGLIIYTFDNDQGVDTLYADQTEAVTTYGDPINQKIYGESKFGKYIVMSVRR